VLGHTHDVNCSLVVRGHDSDRSLASGHGVGDVSEVGIAVAVVHVEVTHSELVLGGGVTSTPLLLFHLCSLLVVTRSVMPH